MGKTFYHRGTENTEEHRGQPLSFKSVFYKLIFYCSLVAQKCESISLQNAIDFLSGNTNVVPVVNEPVLPKVELIQRAPKKILNSAKIEPDFSGFIWYGEKVACKNQKQTYIEVLEKMRTLKPDFFQMLYDFPAQQKSSRRRWLAKSREDLYLKVLNLREDEWNYIEFEGWFIDTNLSKDQKENRLKIACKILGIKFGDELQVFWK